MKLGNLNYNVTVVLIFNLWNYFVVVDLQIYDSKLHYFMQTHNFFNFFLLKSIQDHVLGTHLLFIIKLFCKYKRGQNYKKMAYADLIQFVKLCYLLTTLL